MSRFARITEDPDYDDLFDDQTDWSNESEQLQENNKESFFAKKIENYPVTTEKTV